MIIKNETVAPVKRAVAHLKRVDPVLRGIIARIGPCTLKPRADYFRALSGAIVAQQLSTKAAATIFGRLCDLFPGHKRPTPDDILGAHEDALRQVGLSRQKLSYLKDLAAKFKEKSIAVSAFPELPDEAIITELVKVKGVGRWSAEMFLIFVLNRPDVLPVGDLGFRRAIEKMYGRPDLPNEDEVRKIAEPWHPYCSFAAWYLWASRDNPPVQGTEP